MHYPAAGGQIGTTPRGGDELAAAGQFDQAEREGRAGEGWTSLFAGGEEWAPLYCTDLGYVHRPHNLGGNTPTLGEFLEGYDCVHIHPVKPGEPCWVYDPATGLITLDPNLTDEVELNCVREMRYIALGCGQ